MGNPDTDVGDEPVQQTQQSRPTSWLRFLIVGYPVCGFMLLYLNQPKYYFDLTQQEHGYNITVLEPGSCADYQLITFLVKMGLVLMSAVILVVAGRLLALLTSLSSTDPRWIVRAGSYSIRGLIACAVLILAIPIPWFLNASVAHVGYDQDTFTALVSRNLRVYPDADKALAGGILDNEKLQDGCDGTIAGQLWCNTPDTHENHEARWATNVRGFERVYAEIESARNIDAANACRKDRNWIWSTNVLKCKEVLEHRPAELEYGNVIIVTNLTQMPTLLSVGLRRPEVEQLPLDWPSEIQFFTNASLGRPPPVLGQNLGLISHLENLQMNWYPKVRPVEPMEIRKCAVEKVEAKCSLALLPTPFAIARFCHMWIVDIVSWLLVYAVCASFLQSGILSTTWLWIRGRAYEAYTQPAEPSKKHRRWGVYQALSWTSRKGLQLLTLSVAGYMINGHLLEIYTTATTPSQLKKPRTSKAIKNNEIDQMTPAGTYLIDIDALMITIPMIVMSIYCLWVARVSSTDLCGPRTQPKSLPVYKIDSSIHLKFSPHDRQESILFRSLLFAPQRWLLKMITKGPPKSSSIILATVLLFQVVVDFSTSILKNSQMSPWLGNINCHSGSDLYCYLRTLAQLITYLRAMLPYITVLALQYWAVKRLHRLLGLLAFTVLAIWSIAFASYSKMVRINNTEGNFDRTFVGHVIDGRGYVLGSIQVLMQLAVLGWQRRAI